MSEEITDAPETKLIGMKALVGKSVSKKVKFMDSQVTVRKLNVSQVMEIQKAAEELKEDSDDGFDVLKTVVRLAVADADDISDEEFLQFPIDELAKLSSEIMKFSGMADKQSGGK